MAALFSSVVFFSQEIHFLLIHAYEDIKIRPYNSRNRCHLNVPAREGRVPHDLYLTRCGALNAGAGDKIVTLQCCQAFEFLLTSWA
jgi:hypothetical protein